MKVDPLLSLTTMTASGCLPCEAELAESITTLAEGDPPPAIALTQWAGVIGVEGELTGDGRIIEMNALRWEGLPLPLRYVSSDLGAHDGAVVVGRITEITRGEHGAINAVGDFDMASVAGREAARHVGEALTNGVSMDLDDVSFEVRVAKDVLEGDPFPLFMAAEPVEEEGDVGPGFPEADADGRITVAEIKADDEVRVTTDGRIRAATIVSIPAFASAQIHLTSDIVEPTAESVVTAEEELEELVAATRPPMEPPVSWFNNPKFTEHQPLTVTADGRVYGHLAQWGTCHISHTQRGQCVPPPHSASGYAHFNLGAVLTAEGVEVTAGKITMDTIHAGERLSATAAASHYEDTGSVIADVHAGEDNWGIWVAGALRPNATPTQIRALRAAPLSGDWRRIGTGLELVAALAVNVPGFAVPRPSGLVAGGVVRSLVAAGMIPPRQVIRPGSPGALSTEDLRYLKRLIARERTEELTLQASGTLSTATDLARRVRASSLAMRAHRKAG